jgi:mannose-1-phosphate guanylyltransferase
MNHLTNEQQRTPKDSRSRCNPADCHVAGRWAVILAGGDGTRLRSLTRAIAGDERPKQFCAILGDETLLDQTRDRVALAVRPAHTMFVLTQTHERFYDSLLHGVPLEQLVAQPKNAGTAPAILYSLLRLSEVNPDSSVAFFPSDHYISDDVAFMSYVESAFEAARSRSNLVILLGIEPEGPEVEYGWIEPISPGLATNTDALSWVRRFWEKPTPELARDLMKRGCLWNSFVMVGRVSAFLAMIRRAVPELFTRFSAIKSALNTSKEKRVIRELYSRLGDVNFSQHVLAASPESLAVLRVRGLTWSDLGRPQRVLSTMADIGLTQRGTILELSRVVFSNDEMTLPLTTGGRALIE